VVRSTNGTEVNVDFEIRAISTDERAVYSRGETTFRRENNEEVRARHTRLYSLHFF
jgi:hypothetical protein